MLSSHWSLISVHNAVCLMSIGSKRCLIAFCFNDVSLALNHLVAVCFTHVTVQSNLRTRSSCVIVARSCSAILTHKDHNYQLLVPFNSLTLPLNALSGRIVNHSGRVTSRKSTGLGRSGPLTTYT